MDILKLARPEILELKPYVSARNSAAADGILLNANEAPFTLSSDAALERLELNRYPHPQPAALLDKLASLYGVSNNKLLVTRGSDEGIDLLARVFCKAGRDAIIECPPCFGMYRIAAAIQDAAVVSAPRLEGHNWQVDVDLLCRTIRESDNAKLVFLTSPNNPTGDLLTREALMQVLEACHENALLVLDEAYIEFCESGSASNLIAEYPQLVILRTMSKAWGAAGLRCGAVLADPLVISLLHRVMAPYPLPITTIDAALQVLSGDAVGRQASKLEQVQVSKSELVAVLTDSSWVSEVWPGAANFVLVRVDDATSLVNFCANLGVRIRDFSSTPSLQGCVRMSIGSPAENSTLISVLNQYGINHE